MVKRRALYERGSTIIEVSVVSTYTFPSGRTVANVEEVGGFWSSWVDVDQLAFEDAGCSP